MKEWLAPHKHVVVARSMDGCGPVRARLPLGSEHIISEVFADPLDENCIGIWLEGIPPIYDDPEWNGGYCHTFFRPVEEIQQFRALLVPAKLQKPEMAEDQEK